MTSFLDTSLEGEQFLRTDGQDSLDRRRARLRRHMASFNAVLTDRKLRRHNL
jgi:hypothetical protein